MPKIFISYRREDSEQVTGRIHDRLEPCFGRDSVLPPNGASAASSGAIQRGDSVGY
jgi:hypothetical protein